MKDDFAWILAGRFDRISDIPRLFTQSLGFFRPLVALSFGLNEHIFGLASFPYGLTNLVLALSCAGLLYELARHLDLSPLAASASAVVWAFNFHGINMAILWLSGRTALLLTLFALLAAICSARRQTALVGVFCLCALLSKEEAVLLPFMLAMSMAVRSIGPGWSIVRASAQAIRITWPSFVALGLYAYFRLQTAAFTPGNAPSYYQFSRDVSVVTENVLQYADRSLTLFLIVAIAYWLYVRQTDVFSSAERNSALIGAMWLTCGFGLTVWLPVRSSLYAVFPSIGSALIFGSVVSMISRVAPSRQVRRAAQVGVILCFLLLPVYWARNVRWVELADLTSLVLRTVNATVPAPGHALVVIGDDSSTRANLANAFGALTDDAATLFFGDRIKLRFEHSARGTETVRIAPGRREIRLDLRMGILTEIP